MNKIKRIFECEVYKCVSEVIYSNFEINVT